ncbi:MAG TPA: nuclear transport factor 2 family protein [Acidimicrobiia bacterium]|jgi:ketosteroid isomerase-like protein|nr:nuclear transport factor 2 family protein [Acidimicrobiia bacterium]
MSEHPNAALYRRMLKRFEEGDPDAFEDALADDVVWWQIGSAEPVRGKAALVQSMQGMDGVDFQVDLHDVLATDDHVVGLVTATVRVGDEQFSYRTAEITHVVDGKVIERWAFSDDTQAIIDFFARIG